MRADLPSERPYLPLLSDEKLQNLAMLSGAASDLVSQVKKRK
jgi:hypothetical protein